MKFSNTLALALLSSAAACTTGDASDVGNANDDDSARTTLERNADSQQGSQSLEQRLLAASGDGGISLATLEFVPTLGLKAYKCPAKLKVTTLTDPNDPEVGLQPEDGYVGLRSTWEIKSAKTYPIAALPGEDQAWRLVCDSDDYSMWNVDIKTYGLVTAKACVALNLPGWIGFICEPQV